MVTANIIDTREPVVANKPFLYDGVQYNQFDPFPWLELGVDERRVNQLFNQRMLMPARMAPPSTKPPTPTRMWDGGGLKGRALWMSAVAKCRELGLPTKGRTNDLVRRITEHLAE